MRRQTISAIVLTVAMFLAGALSAIAKGPGSATLDGPEIEEPVQFLDLGGGNQSHSDAAVEMLRLTGLWYGPGPESVQPPTGALGAAYRVSWGDQAVPAEVVVQHLYLDAQGGPIIHTPDQPGLEGWGPGVVGWFEAPDGLEDAIDEILARHGADDTSSGWKLPLIAAVGLLAMIGGSRWLDPQGAQASTNSANDSVD